jgi:hypothetical protein
MTRRIALALLLALSGCAQWDNDRCASYGFEQGTDAFANCRQNIDIQRSNALMNLSNQLQVRHTHCSSYWGQTYCTTY